MLNYVKAELYKVFHRKYVFIFLLVMFLGETALCMLWRFSSGNDMVSMDFADAVRFLAFLLGMGLYATIITGDMVFSEQYKHSTLKNEVAYGIPRSRIYVGKLLAECVLAGILCVVIIGYYIGLNRILFPQAGEGDGEAVRWALQALGACLPLWLASQALFHLFSTLFKSTGAAFATVMVYLLLPNVFKILAVFVNEGFQLFYEIMLTTQVDVVAGGAISGGVMARCWITGGVWFLGTTVIGNILFRKREII